MAVQVPDDSTARLAVVLSFLALLAFGGYALVVTHRDNWARGSAPSAAEFVTARGSAGRAALAWSLYASAMGSWVIAGPADYAAFAGLLGLCMYALAAGLPLVAIAFLGNKLQRRFPSVLSLSDFAALRFGGATQALVLVIALFNMSIATCAEYTTIAGLFGEYVGFEPAIMAGALGLVALVYTTYGGLGVSIKTDRAQAIVSLALFATVLGFLAATFRLPKPVSELDRDVQSNLYGLNLYGYSSILTMPLSLMTATVFSEAMWQRVWASESESAMRQGAALAAFAVTAVVFTVGLTGLLSEWAELDVANPNLRLFYVLGAQPITAIGVVVVVLAVTMSESAVDSLMNGIGAAVSGAGLAKLSCSLGLSRAVVVLFNVPLIVVGLLQLNVISLFLISNMVCTAAAFPVVLGVSEHRVVRHLLRDAVPPLAFVAAMAALVGYGTAKAAVDGSSVADNLWAGVRLAFYENGYAYDFFLVGLGSSMAATAMLMAVVRVVRGPVPEASKDFEELDPDF